MYIKLPLTDAMQGCVESSSNATLHTQPDMSNAHRITRHCTEGSCVDSIDSTVTA